MDRLVKGNREGQKQLLETALLNLRCAYALSKIDSEFALDGCFDEALRSLELAVERHIL